MEGGTANDRGRLRAGRDYGGDEAPSSTPVGMPAAGARSPCDCPRIANSLKRLGMGKAVVCVQEIPRWTSGRVWKGTRYVVHSSRSKQDEIDNVEGFDCGFLLPGALNPYVRDEQYGRYWGGLVLANGPTEFILFLT
eukprot:10323458-Karenia_brevis.AAC.1